MTRKHESAAEFLAGLIPHRSRDALQKAARARARETQGEDQPHGFERAIYRALGRIAPEEVISGPPAAWTR